MCLLSERPFLPLPACFLGETPTIADIALYSHAADAPEVHVSRETHPKIRDWIQ